MRDIADLIKVKEVCHRIHAKVESMKTSNYLQGDQQLCLQFFYQSTVVSLLARPAI